MKQDDGDASVIAEYCESYREIYERILDGEIEPNRLPQRCQAYFNIPESQWKDESAVAVRKFHSDQITMKLTLERSISGDCHFLLSACECNVTGSVTPICDKLTGQCPCRPGVVGRKCNQCDVYHYHFSSSGCTGKHFEE